MQRATLFVIYIFKQYGLLIVRCSLDQLMLQVVTVLREVEEVTLTGRDWARERVGTQHHPCFLPIGLPASRIIAKGYSVFRDRKLA